MRLINVLGDKYGKLTVIAELERAVDNQGFKRRRMLCRCECGKEISVRLISLRRGNTKTCGCVRIKHGGTYTKEYRAWWDMQQRCNNPRHDRYASYGGRGIKVCEAWREFENFIRDMGTRPSSDHSIDRTDNDGNYEPGNCRWATRSEQQRNTRRTREQYAEMGRMGRKKQ